MHKETQFCMSFISSFKWFIQKLYTHILLKFSSEYINFSTKNPNKNLFQRKIISAIEILIHKIRHVAKALATVRMIVIIIIVCCLLSCVLHGSNWF